MRRITLQNRCVKTGCCSDEMIYMLVNRWVCIICRAPLKGALLNTNIHYYYYYYRSVETFGLIWVFNCHKGIWFGWSGFDESERNGNSVDNLGLMPCFPSTNR